MHNSFTYHEYRTIVVQASGGFLPAHQNINDCRQECVSGMHQDAGGAGPARVYRDVERRVAQNHAYRDVVSDHEAVHSGVCAEERQCAVALQHQGVGSAGHQDQVGRSGV